MTEAVRLSASPFFVVTSGVSVLMKSFLCVERVYASLTSISRSLEV